MRIQIIKIIIFLQIIKFSCWKKFKMIKLIKIPLKYIDDQRVITEQQTGNIKGVIQQFKIQQQQKSVSYCMQQKMQVLRKYINLAIVLDLQNYQLSMHKWFQFRKLFHQVDQPMIKRAFQEFLPVVKPVVYNFSQILSKATPEQYGFYTSLSAQQVTKIKQLFEPLQKFQIIQQSLNLNNRIEDDQIQKLVLKPTNPIYILNLQQAPQNKEIQWWNHSVPVKNTSVISQVVKGKGVGAKQLGMPTANLKMTPQIQKQLLQYPNGIYIAKFKFIEKDFDGKNEFTAVASIGMNPHYENFTNCRCVEAYVINNFKEQKFYGQKASLELLRLIRLQGKFPSFDSFLNAMHNDIQIGKLYGI